VILDGDAALGVLVLRLWVESEHRLRIRVSTEPPVDNRPETSYAATKADALHMVEDWIDQLSPPEVPVTRR